ALVPPGRLDRRKAFAEHELLDLGHLASTENRRDLGAARAVGDAHRADLAREDRGEADAEDRHGHHDLEQCEAEEDAPVRHPGSLTEVPGSSSSSGSYDPSWIVPRPVSGAISTVIT